MKAILKILVFATIGFATWLTTSAILAQYPKTATTRPATIKTQVKQVIGDKSVQPEAASVQHPNMIASMRLRSFNVFLAGNNAHVRGAVSMADKRPGMTYVWRLSVDDFDHGSIAGSVYADQVFAMEADGQMEPTFDDVIELPAGSRRVVLSLHALAPTEDLSIFEDETRATGSQVIRAVKLLTK